ncbi:MAG: glycine zipper 2TM domain-containing protein [Pseudomonadota bacterium]
MTHRLLAPAALILLSQAAWANSYDQAQVLSVAPVYGPSAHKKQRVCEPGDETPAAGGTSATGVIIGGIAGGLLGNQVGKGRGKTAATAAGAVAGALAGNAVANSQAAPPAKQRCQLVNAGAERISAYMVTYEYAGKTNTVRMMRDPGPTVTVAVTVVK